MSYLTDIESGKVYGAMVRGPLAAPYSLAQLIAAGLIGLTPVDPLKSAEWPATGAVAFRARYEYTWTAEDMTNPPIVLAAVLDNPPRKLLFAAPWSLPAGFPMTEGMQIAVPIFLTVQPE